MRRVEEGQRAASCGARQEGSGHGDDPRKQRWHYAMPALPRTQRRGDPKNVRHQHHGSLLGKYDCVKHEKLSWIGGQII